MLMMCAFPVASVVKAQGQVKATVTDPSPITMEALFEQADLVAVVRILSGDTEHYKTAVYKAEVLQPFKNGTKGSTIFFGPFEGYGLGQELVVFLRRSKNGAVPNQQGRAPGLSYGSVAILYLVMYGGYSALDVKYECVFDGKEVSERCDYGVRINTAQVKLPRNIKTYPSSTRGDSSQDTNWVRRRVLIAYLNSLCEIQSETLGCVQTPE